MIGALIGDIAGSRFEWHNYKSKKFELFDRNCSPTDDSVMSLAVAKAILDCKGDYNGLSDEAVKSMQKLGRRYEDAGYGRSFYKWIWDEKPQPYNSYGNGSAMRVSPCGYAAKSVQEAKELSAKATEISHNHPEGMKGAEAIAVAIFLAREGKSKDEIEQYIRKQYYDIDFTLDGIRPSYKFDVSCQGSVPVALEAFFESESFEDAIRNAISVGGDSDTIAAITGSVAEAYYGVPEQIIEAAVEFLDSRQMKILYYFEKKYPSKAISEEGETELTVFNVLDDMVDKIIPKGTPITIDESLPDGMVRVSVDDSCLVPDFSSFDRQDKGGGVLGVLADVGAGVAKVAVNAGKGIASVAGTVGRDIIDNRKRWYNVGYLKDKSDGRNKHNLKIIKKAAERGYLTGYVQIQGCRTWTVKCTEAEIKRLVEECGADKYGYRKMDWMMKSMIQIIRDND